MNLWHFWSKSSKSGRSAPTAIVTESSARWLVRSLIADPLPNCAVFSYDEIDLESDLPLHV